MPEPLAEQRKLIDEIWQLIEVSEEHIDRIKRTIRETQALVAKHQAPQKSSIQDQTG